MHFCRCQTYSLCLYKLAMAGEITRRVSQLWSVCLFAFRWGWIPLIITLGIRRGADPGMPEPNLIALFWG